VDSRPFRMSAYTDRGSEEIKYLLRRRGISHDTRFGIDSLGEKHLVLLDKGFRGGRVLLSYGDGLSRNELLETLGALANRVDPSFPLCRHTERAAGACVECENP
jgi:hypothetical protein